MHSRFHILIMDVYNSFVKLIIYKLFDKTFGVLIRLFQASLIEKKKPNDLISVVKSLAVNDSAQFAIDHLAEAMQFKEKQSLWHYCLEKMHEFQIKSSSTEQALVIEFGVFEGASINFFARNSPNSRILGFDSFEGLEEDWTGGPLTKGHFNKNGKIPKCERNVSLIVGLFESTLPKFVTELQDKQISLLHMDADTYKPTIFVLKTLKRNLRSGTIIIFDEFFGFSGWRFHEFKAWQEIISTNPVKYRYIAYSNEQVAIEIL